MNTIRELLDITTRKYKLVKGPLFSSSRLRIRQENELQKPSRRIVMQRISSLGFGATHHRVVLDKEGHDTVSTLTESEICW